MRTGLRKTYVVWGGRNIAPVEDTGEEGEELVDSPEPETEGEGDSGDDLSSSNRYRTQRRGGGGLIDIKTSKRNGPVVGIVRVTDADELLMMTIRGKIQRVAAKEISIIGRNTQGVKIMSVDDGDKLTAIVQVPAEESVAEEVEEVERQATSKPAIPPAPPVAMDEDRLDGDASTGEGEEE